MLKLISDEEYSTYNIYMHIEPCDCYIRGAANYYNTKSLFVGFKGNLFWSEPSVERNTNGEMLVMDIDIKTTGDNAQDILCGMSGCPILINKDGKNFVVGIFVHIFEDKIASKCYGVPIKNVIDNCLILLGLYSYVSIEANKMQISNNTSMDAITLFINVLFKPDSFSLEDYDQEVTLWNEVSNQFYMGNNIDEIFFKFIDSKEFEEYSLDIQVIVRYFLAKMLFKRNKPKEAFLQFTNILNCSKKLSRKAGKRMEVLMMARSSIESTIQNPQNELDSIRSSGNEIINLKGTSNIYNVNELASITGKGLTNFFGHLNNHIFSPSAKNAITEIFDLHTMMLQNYPVFLQKQDVVNTSLKWLTNIWGIKGDTDEKVLYGDAMRGFDQSLKRKNSIFYIQSMNAYAISLLLQGESSRALNAFFSNNALTY